MWLAKLGKFVNFFWGYLLKKLYLDDNARAADDFSRFSGVVDFAETSPLAQFLVVVDLDQRNLVLVAKGLHEFLVHCLVAVFGQDAQHCLPPENLKKKKKNILLQFIYFILIHDGHSKYLSTQQQSQILQYK